jgi:hypothetical protein
MGFSAGLAKPSGRENGACEITIWRHPDGHRGARAGQWVVRGASRRSSEHDTMQIKKGTHLLSSHFGRNSKGYSACRKKDLRLRCPRRCRMVQKRREWKGARLMTERGCGRKFVVLNCCRSEKKVASISPPSHSLAPPQHLGVVCACPPALDR